MSDLGLLEQTVLGLLRRGLDRDILAMAFSPAFLIRSLVTASAAGIVSAARRVARARISGQAISDWIGAAWLRPDSPPPIMRVNRTDAFRNVLEKQYCPGVRLTDVSRKDLAVVLNACDLRTGSAFRFGSRETGCWRFGVVENRKVNVAEAVAASAAYPALLPSMDREYTFVRNGVSETNRVLLTAGGVFENLGVSCMEPGRSAGISTNVFRPDYIICCDAGSGLFADQYPTWWATRMQRSFETMFRKVRDATRSRLHRYVEQGELRGFVMPYLGQLDESLPWLPSDLPERATVIGYPSDLCQDDE